VELGLGGDSAVVSRLTRLTATTAALLRSTTLAGMWERGLASVLDPLFARTPPPGWRVPQASPPGWCAPQTSRVVEDIAAARTGTGVQQPGET